MALNANVTINVPALADSDVWFANAQAWSNYWVAVPATVSISITTALYAAVAYDTNLLPANIQIDGTDYALVTTEMFNSLLARVTALNSAFENFRTELKNAGLITNAQ